MTKAEHLHRIDSVKLVAVVMVVTIHASWYMYTSEQRSFWTYDVYRGALDIAVPIFLVLSGYFLARKDARGIVSWSSRVFALYLAATGMYVAFDVLRVLTDRIFLDRGLRAGVRAVVEDWTMSSFVRGDLAEVHLWYLIACAIAGLILAFMRSRGASSETMLAVAGAVWVVSLTGLVDLSPVVVSGGFPRALVFLALGVFLAERNVQGSRRHLAVMVSALAVYTLLRYLGAGSAKDLLIVVAAYALGAYAVRPGTRPTIMSRLGRRSLTVYILHMMFISAATRTVQYAGLDFDTMRDEPWFTAVLVVIATVLSLALHRPFVGLVVRPVTTLSQRLVSAVR